MGLHALSELGRENIPQDDHRNLGLPARSPSVPVHSIPLVLMVALAFTTATSFGALREHFHATISDKAAVSISSFDELNTLSGNQFSNQPIDLSQSLNLSVFTPEVQRWGVQIERWAEDYDLPVELVAIVMQIESCGDPTVVSSAGARGLFQVMPFHFGAGEDWMDSEINALRGMEYLARSYLLSDGEIDVTLAGYNGGHSVITRHPSTWPAETQRYVYWGMGIWGDLESDTVPSPTLHEWLIAGGEHLCKRAVDVPIPSDSLSRHSDNGATPIG